MPDTSDQPSMEVDTPTTFDKSEQSESPTYWKVLHKDGKHYKHVWTPGLNVLDETEVPFDADPTHDCVPGRLYYCETKDVTEWLSFGVQVQRVYEPTDDPAFRCVTPTGGRKKGANRLILDPTVYSLDDPRTYDMLGIDLSLIPYITKTACHYGWVRVLDTCRTRRIADGRAFELTSTDVDWASSNGHVAVLDWWLKAAKSAGIEFKHTAHAINGASLNSQVD